MKVKTLGAGYSARMPDGTFFSPIPGLIIDIDDSDDALVAFFRGQVEAGLVAVLEDVKSPPEPAVTELAPRRGRPPLPRDSEGNVIRE
jgi:hypothetical protein